ncbi:P-loop containing nucleoside triphosphate hydrolase protein [Lactarius tabidus]
MPTPPYVTALFAAGPKLWEYPKWQERTNYIIPPFSSDATPSLTGLRLHEISAVKAMATKVHAMETHQEILVALSKERDNDAGGKVIWNDWAMKRFDGWNVVQDIEAVLMDEGRHPRQLINQQGFDRKVPTMGEAGISEIFGLIGVKLFGDDTYRDPDVMRPLIKEELSKLISSIVAHIWHKMRKRVATQYERLQKGKKDVETDFNAEINSIKDGSQLKASDLQKWFKRVDRLKVLATSFNEGDAINILNKQIDRMNMIYKALTGDDSLTVTKGLSRNLREALKYLAKQTAVTSLLMQLAERLELHTATPEELIELDLEPADPMDWREGVEELRMKTEDELYFMLGFKDKKIPFLASEIDAEADIGAQPYENEDATDVAVSMRVLERQPLSLRWHQLVGLVKLVKCALTSEAVLLMDDVGLGKTLQVLAFFSVLAYYRQFYADAKREKTILPDHPFLFVVPPTLVDQVAFECNRFLESGSFDIIKYVSGHNSHKGVWQALDQRSHTKPHMRIFAVQSDSGYIHEQSTGSRIPTLSTRGDGLKATTIYRQDYLAIAIDEAHAFRNTNKLHRAVRALRDRTDLMVAMTATPVQTRPMDLWNIGRAVGIRGFREEEQIDAELSKMARDIARAKREDRKMRPDHETESRVALNRVFQGEQDGSTIVDTQHAVDLHFRKANAQWMKTIRAKYEGVVIRRTSKSLDYAGRPILELEPYEEHICMLLLLPHEYDALEKLAATALDDNSVARRFSSEVTKNFYLDIRRCLLHPCFANIMPSSISTKYDEYSDHPSCKIESLVEIINHHLSMDGAPGMRPSRQRTLEEFMTSHKSQSLEKNQSIPDKIIVYSFFTSSFELIDMVLKRRGIQALSIHGNVGLRDRRKTLEAFKQSGRDGPRVLLISNVGSVGLNIAFANILIIVDVLWSALSDQQLIGRVWRPPQSKRVHIYRLIGGRSPDVLLNNMSFGKTLIQDTFMNIGDSLRT